MRQFAHTRLLTLALLFALLAVLLVWGGASDIGAGDTYPDAETIHETPQDYLGERVTVGGTVVATDPITVEAETTYGEYQEYIIENTDRTPATGDQLTVHGTLEDDTRIAALDSRHSTPADFQYMYAVSIVAAIWLAARILNGWTVDTSEWALVSRTEPLVTLGR